MCDASAGAAACDVCWCAASAAVCVMCDASAAAAACDVCWCAASAAAADHC